MARASLLFIAAVAVTTACGDDAAMRASDDTTVDEEMSDEGANPVDTNDEEDEGTEDTGASTDDGVEPGCDARIAPPLSFESVGSFEQPVFLTAAPGDSDHLYIVEKEGTIRVFDRNTSESSVFLRVPDILVTGEQGLLSMAFAPDYAESGRFFVYVTPGEPRRNAVDEYRRSDANPFVADPEPVQRLFSVNDEFSNHNGGNLQFGADGFLYVSIGDEGSGGDPNDNGLDTNTLFGSILRLDINNNEGRFSAVGNPFLDGGGNPLVWALGARNPWRISFDRSTGDLYVADVGQNAFEEVSVIEPGTTGANLGWSAFEGFDVFAPAKVDRVEVHHEPVIAYAHGDFDSESIRGGNSITGGYVYRGDAITGLDGFYLFGDFNSPDIAAFRYCGGEATSVQRITFSESLPGGLASFGQDGDGEIYIVFITGPVVRLIASE